MPAVQAGVAFDYLLTMAILTKAGVAFDVSPFPKLKALHGALRADPALALYFASDMYKR